MYFGIGELTLSANREQVYLDQRTQEKITQRLQEMQTGIKKLLDDKIDQFPNLWQANIYYRQELNNAFHDLRFLGKLYWKNIPLHSGWIQVECPAFTFGRGKYSRKYGTDPNKLHRSRMTSIHFEEHSQIFINDLPIKEPTSRYIKKAFEDDPKLQSVQLICPTEKVTEEILNKTIHLDQMAPRRLSEIAKATGRAYTSASSRLLLFKFDSRDGVYRQVSYASIEEDSNDKVLCLLQKNDSTPIVRLPLLKDISLNLEAIKCIVDKFSQTSFYGVDNTLPAERIEEEFGDFQTLQDFIDSKILNNKTINYVEIKFAIEHRYDADHLDVEVISRLRKLIQDPDSLFWRRADLHGKIKDINAGDTGLLYVYESVKGAIGRKEIDKFSKDHPEWDINKINLQYCKTYPLLESISEYDYPKLVDHVAQYINLIDQWNRSQKQSIKEAS